MTARGPGAGTREDRRAIEALRHALEFDEPARGAFLAGLERDDPPVGTAVRALLRAHERESPWLLDAPLLDLAAVRGDLEDAVRARPLAEGSLVGRYRLGGVIAHGGMATVYEATQESPPRPVAIKVLHGAAWVPPLALRRFLDEAQILARLQHECIARVYECGVHRPDSHGPGLPYIALERIEGALEQATSSGSEIQYVHDAWNRLVRAEHLSTNPLVTISNPWLLTNRYNALHWRIASAEIAAGTTGSLDRARTMIYGASWQVLQEEVDTNPSTNAGTDQISQTVWGARYIDDAVLRRTDTDLDGDEDQRFYYVTDTQFSVRAVLDDASPPNLVERVRYSAYGEARHGWRGDVNGDGATTLADRNAIGSRIGDTLGDPNEDYAPDCDLDRSGTIDWTDYNMWIADGFKSALPSGWISDAAVGNTVGFCGYQYSAASGLYLARHRWYSPALGRFLERDPLGYAAGANLVEYVGSSPAMRLDPLGLDWTGKRKPNPPPGFSITTSVGGGKKPCKRSCSELNARLKAIDGALDANNCPGSRTSASGKDFGKAWGQSAADMVAGHAADAASSNATLYREVYDLQNSLKSRPSSPYTRRAMQRHDRLIGGAARQARLARLIGGGAAGVSVAFAMKDLFELEAKLTELEHQSEYHRGAHEMSVGLGTAGAAWSVMALAGVPGAGQAAIAFGIYLAIHEGVQWGVDEYNAVRQATFEEQSCEFLQQQKNQTRQQQSSRGCNGKQR